MRLNTLMGRKKERREEIQREWSGARPPAASTLRFWISTRPLRRTASGITSSADALDLSGAWRAYDHGSTAGSISLLVRSGTNIGISQQFNLSDSLGSGLYLNCLQGGGPQQPITLNILYWRQDFLNKRLSFYVGKIHPNEYVTLSMFNNDERTQFLNGANDGNLAVAYDGTYAGGGAVEFQATRHVFIHAIAVDTEGGQQRNIDTLVDRKYAEGVEIGWASGSLGEKYRHYRIGMWRDDTKNSGSGYGGGFGFDHEFSNGWTPFGRFALSTSTGTAIKQIEGVGLAQGVHSDVAETCSQWHSTTPKPHMVNIVKAYLNPFIASASLKA
jgi:porin